MARWPTARVLRKIPTGPNPPPSDLFTLLGSDLRVFYDTRFGGEFAPGLWTAHRDLVSGLRLSAPSLATRVASAADGSNFKGRQVQRIASAGNTKLTNRFCGNIVPAGSTPEIFMVARVVTFPAAFAQIVGCANAFGSTSVGAQLYVVNATTYASVVGGAQTAATFSDTSAPHIFDSFNDGANSVNLVDNTVISTVPVPATAFDTEQIAVGGLQVGFTISADAFVAAWGIINPPMTSAKRTRFNDILRNDWGF